MAKKKADTPATGGSPPPRVVDPADLVVRLGDPADRGKVALGLDLGMRCGYCYSDCRADGKWSVYPWGLGYWDLAAGRYDTGNLSFLKLRRFLDVVRPQFIFYEEVKYTPDEAITKYSAGRILARCATASELLGAFRQTVLLWAEDHGAVCTGFPIGTIKRQATGKGNANKQDMVAACNARFGTDFGVEDCEQTGADDAADAAFALVCGLTEFGTTLQDFEPPSE